jgi:hypothetical protein
MITMPSQLTGESKEKFELLKDHFKGVFELLHALDKHGYRPDHFTSVALDVAIDKLYAEIER